MTLVIILLAPVLHVMADEDWIDGSQGSVSNGVYTAKNDALGAKLTINNASYVYSSSGFYHLKLSNQDATTTVSFTFQNKNIGIKKFWYNAYVKKTKKVLWTTTSYSEKVSLSCGEDGNSFSRTDNADGSVTWTCTGKMDNIFLNSVYLTYNPKDDILANPPTGVTKDYTGSSQPIYAVDENAYSYSSYYYTSFKCPYGSSSTILLKFSGADDKGLATDKGTYTVDWKYDVSSYSGYTFNSFVYTRGGLMYIEPTGSDWLGTITSTINGLGMTDIVEPTAKTLVYTGEPQTLVTAASSPQGKGMYWVPGDAGWSEAIPEKTDAGTYKVYWYLESTQKAYNDYGGAGEDTRKGPITVTISKVNIPAYTAPTPLTKVYNGNEQPLVSAGSATGGTLRYRLGTDGEWLEEVPKAMPMGDYEIYWYVVGDNNHYDMGSESEPYGPLSAHITPAEYNMNTLKWQGTSTVIYDGLDHQSELTLIESSLPAGVAITSYTLKDGSNADATEAVNAGTYTLTAHLTSTNPNYAAPDPVSTTLTIQPFNLQNAYFASAIADQTYTAEAITPASPELKVKIGGVTIPSSAYSITYLNNINAGVNTATATLYANGTDGNYTGSTAVKFTILRKTVRVRTEDQVITYGDALNSSVEKAGLEDAVTGHSISSVTLTADQTLGIGEYPNAIVASDVHIKDGSDNDVTDNYTITYPEGYRGKLTITAKAGTGFTISGLNAEYEGDGVTAVAPDGDIAVYDGTTKLALGTDYTVAYTNNTLAGTATVTFTFRGNYGGTTTKNFTIYYVAETFSRSATPAYNYCTYYHPTEKLKAVGGDVFFCTLNDTKTDVMLTQVLSNVINAGVPVMLRTSSTSKAVKLYATDAADETYSGTNALTGVGSSEAYPVGKPVTSSDKIFIFDGESFVWATSGHLVKHKAFINDIGFSFSRIYIVYGDDETTGLIPTEDVGDNMEDVWYDLMGNRINKPTRKGLYILNGKKVLVKTSGRAER